MKRAEYSKKQARQAIQTRLGGIDDTAYSLLSAAVYDRVRVLFGELGGVNRILSYRPYEKWREVDISNLECECKNTQFDYVSSSKDAPMPNVSFDVIFVPLYGFNEPGYRLGHGGGWYDRLLSQQPSALKIGVGLEECLINFPADLHDISMDIIVTERRTISYKT